MGNSSTEATNVVQGDETKTAIHQPRSDHESTQPHKHVDGSLIGEGKAMPKLPKLIIPKLTGEAIKFRSFWDSFDSAIYKNNSLSVVDKFNYLHALLEARSKIYLRMGIIRSPLCSSSYSNVTRQIWKNNNHFSPYG